MSSPQPAHSTKHLPQLSYPFQHSTFILNQQTDGSHNGTALWLGGQILALFLANFHARFTTNKAPPRAIELGSGIGLTALALSSLGWDVLATDIRHVVDAVLSKNIDLNATALPPASGTIQIRELDWTVEPDKWSWRNPVSVTSSAPTVNPPSSLLQPPFDLIFSADTVYSRELVSPLLRTLHSLSTLSQSLSGRYPTILLCVENRDPILLAALFEEARQEWNFGVDRIPRTRLAKCIEKAGLGWDKEDWAGVEIWKLRLS
ncbi:hypothetical protein CC1G_11934 [Coprinopsis cinerea okayama7|uniref:Uncharacterized protein n=1 Tax=Coprinopsis cinerea (strain Okayama-7 / 130 / ATCC MYA-4618 / FGSC 9003) TaxID=240176 RepID=A8NFS5_COPC7|nr:hypothetical protein CC1G_11934 [Coprinopsis cinerea okayama7\|eukprot:XP_001833357.1 hypothetical protein CC1G_11934 [Coprinopsis cinerea okayama7\